MKNAKSRPVARQASQSGSWEAFLFQLQAIKSLGDSLDLLRRQHEPGASGRLYFSNLGWFMQFFTPPREASIEELSQYLRIFRRIVGELGFPPSVAVAVEDALETAIESGQPYEARCA